MIVIVCSSAVILQSSCKPYNFTPESLQSSMDVQLNRGGVVLDDLSINYKGTSVPARLAQAYQLPRKSGNGSIFFRIVDSLMVSAITSERILTKMRFVLQLRKEQC